jgi:MFS family permease
VLGSVFGSTAAGELMTRIGRKGASLLAIVVASIAMYLTASADSFWSLYAGLFFAGGCGSATMLTTKTLLSELYPASRAGFWMNLIHGFYQVQAGREREREREGGGGERERARERGRSHRVRAAAAAGGAPLTAL